MRFSVLEIPAFGPFTDFRYEFQGNTEADFHIFLGNNESGKSSLLRAISHLLYGIPQQTPENFKHDYKKLLLQAELGNSSDERLYIRRRKAKTDKQLTNEDDVPLRQEVLNAFMGNLSQEGFHSLFGLGADELQQGNEMLLSTQGALADTMAAASSGSLHLSQAVQSLLRKSESIYKRQGNSRLKTLKQQIKEYERQMRAAITRPQVWNDLNDKLKSIEARLSEIKQELLQIEQSISHSDRMRQGIESVGLLARRQSELEELGLPANLAAGFTESLSALLANWKTTSNTNAVTNQRVIKINAEMQELVVCKQIVDAETDIEQLGANLNLYKERFEKAQELKNSLSDRRAELEVLLKNFNNESDINAIEKIRVTVEQQINCSEKFAIFTELSTQVEDLEKQINTTTVQLEELNQQQSAEASLRGEAADVSNSSAVAVLNELDQAIEFGYQQQTASESLLAHQQVNDSVAKELGLLITRLKLDTSKEDVRALAVPRRNTIIEYRDQLSQLSRQKDSLESELQELLQQREKQQSELDSLLENRELPSKESLAGARQHRNQLWEAMSRSVFADSKSENVDITGSGNEFVAAISHTDNIADALIDNAELVAATDQKKTNLEQLASKQADIQTKLDRAAAQWQDTLSEWRTIWQGIRSQPESPAAMLDWRDDWVKACDGMQELEEKQQKYNLQQKAVAEALSRLLAIPGLPESIGIMDADNKCSPGHLRALLGAAVKRKKGIDEAQGANRQSLEFQQGFEAKLTELKLEKEKLIASWRKAGQQLHTAFTDIGIRVKSTDSNEVQSPDSNGQALLSPGSAQILLDERISLIKRFDEYQRFEGELSQLDSLMSEYEKKIVEVAAKLDIEQESNSIEALCNRLVQALREQRAIYEKSRNLEFTLKQENDSLEKTSIELQDNLAMLTDALDSFAVKSPDELIAMQSRFLQSEKLMTEIRAIKDTLSAISTGTDLQEFVAEVESQELDKLAAEGARLKSRKLELQAENESLFASKALLQEQRRTLDEKHGDAADIQQQLELSLEQQKECVLDFIRTRLAADMLKRTLDEFRDRNAGPLIDDASSLFKRLTCSNYERIALTYSDDEKPYIKGERANGDQLAVEAMSDGTRDQLYLAMRLAALKMRLGTHEPMPLIVDDLLITFDDERTEAALDVLADLSRLTQVILFTHHGRVPEAGKKLLLENQVAITDLKKCA